MLVPLNMFYKYMNILGSSIENVLESSVSYCYEYDYNLLNQLIPSNGQCPCPSLTRMFKYIIQITGANRFDDR